MKILLACLLTGLIFAAGCQSCPLNRGAYASTDGTTVAPAVGDVRGQSAPPAGTATTVPLFASRSVKEEARNRQTIERYTGRPVVARPVTSDDLIAWRQANVPDEAAIKHLRIHGATRPPAPQEVLVMQQRGVSNDVIRTMQEHPHPKVNAPTPPVANQQQYVAPPIDRVRGTIRSPGTLSNFAVSPGQPTPIYPSYGEDMTVYGNTPIMHSGCEIIHGGTYMETPQGLVPICAPMGCGCCCD